MRCAQVAEELTHTCWQMYHQMATGRSLCLAAACHLAACAVLSPPDTATRSKWQLMLQSTHWSSLESILPGSEAYEFKQCVLL